MSYSAYENPYEAASFDFRKMEAVRTAAVTLKAAINQARHLCNDNAIKDDMQAAADDLDAIIHDRIDPSLFIADQGMGMYEPPELPLFVPSPAVFVGFGKDGHGFALPAVAAE